jgi:hypothetical protein
VVGPHSGAAGLAYWIMGYFKPVDLVIDKKHPLVSAMKDLIDKQFADGRTTSLGDEEMEQMVRDFDEELYIKLTHHWHKK